MFAQDFPLKYIEGLPDNQTKDVPVSHAYILKQHNSMCVACAVTRAGERMLEYDGFPDARYVVAWTHNAGRNIANNYKSDEIGVYGSDAALAISAVGFLRWDALSPYEQRELKANPLTQFDWGGEQGWKFLFDKYKEKTDKYPIVCPTNVNEIALCLRKGLPVLFLSSAQWKPIKMRDVDGKGGTRLEFGTTQYGRSTRCLFTRLLHTAHCQRWQRVSSRVLQPHQQSRRTATPLKTDMARFDSKGQ